MRRSAGQRHAPRPGFCPARWRRAVVAPNRFKICVTRALERPSRRAIAAREATSPVSICRSHSRARCSESCRSPVTPRRGGFLAAAKSTTMQVAKLLLEELLGSNLSRSFGFGDHQPATEVKTRATLVTHARAIGASRGARFATGLRRRKSHAAQPLRVGGVRARLTLTGRRRRPEAHEPLERCRCQRPV